ncbi:MAG: hypothetical protein C5B46_06905 [Proteobacteria bacterium]|nr:MAG: hypothetical protein C5B46_06905 [Pseudomonadota bacterium]
MVMYRAYYGAAGCGALQPLEKYRCPFREFSRLDEAFLWAGCVAARGTAVLAIDGDDGTQLSQSEIAVGMLCHREVHENPTVEKAHTPFSDDVDPAPATA